ncbi:Protein of unknown function (DUF2911) [Aquimarina sp. MAR_2010_214]|uniref:DUF2911 domain-containing protein n=1 Tax=Aquimarina sp. MAR_2010_214 TaxID=1250026 RepID=UPI000C714612|nr:DUF2911 domain-containing protein [Aquimarina sp. MAR_2010_214]PKV49083.1 Protein of unknown function (DUF2911) [Aquimarina sp. MAR_2010_214]
MCSIFNERTIAYIKNTPTQQLGVADITINYSSPSANNREIWNDLNVIPQNGNPIAWHAGANMNNPFANNFCILLLWEQQNI